CARVRGVTIYYFDYW
nr:immunoglobulin heavy chain junction region [Macaca mulatta]MOX59701.1 immunoglobulin heavy chain junction region [Macaca mulatta]MOX59712.1 immunoglobulin heavy chain junction region [Macaca mulatta]MOX61396.1 immunoglobulin heavy chain junction region [Macaca mulatta]MOX61616.1 immunoglobulin heavy chain junction region [Macaca mulatta]